MMTDAEALIQLVRPTNCLMVCVAVLIGEVVVHRSVSLLPTVLGFITGFAITGASMVSNDYWDISIDKINRPDRPIPSGRVSKREAEFCAVSLSIVGLSASFFTNFPASTLISSIGLGMFILYNYRLKKSGLLGNILVSASIALPLIYGGVIQPQSPSSIRSLFLLTIFEAMIFLSNTGREVNKGIGDIEGDNIRNIHTVALKHGPKGAALLSAALYLSAVALSPMPWLLGLASWPYLPIVIVTDLGFIASSFILLRDYSKESALRMERLVLLWMLLGLLSFMAGAMQ